MSIVNEQSPLQMPQPQQTPQPTPTSQPTVMGAASTWRWMDGVWRFLIDPKLLTVLSLLLLVLILVGISVPQLPGQLRSEPLAADRWLAVAAAGYGVLGGVLRALSAFDVLHSPLFLSILVALIFVLLVHTADAAMIALSMWRLPALLDSTTLPSGEALPATLPRRVERWRGAVALSPAAVMQACEAGVRAWAGQIERRLLRVAPAPAQAEPPFAVATDTSSMVTEERLLGISGLIESVLRPLLPVGMVLALLVVAWYSIVGYSFLPAPLLPGERTSDAVLGLTAEYQLGIPQPGVLGPVLKVTRGDLEHTLPLQSLSASLEDVMVAVQPGAPALAVYTVNGSALLSRPGQSNRTAMTGVGFPDPGSEQVLVLPESGVGIRMIRQDSAGVAAELFVIEVFQGDSESPVQRFTVGHSEVKRIETSDGDILLGFAPIAMFQMQAYTMPGVWWLIPALMLAIVGALGFRRRPTFLLVQAGPWPVERSVVILQSDRPGEIEAVRRTLNG